jgi:hypothetical protein
MKIKNIIFKTICLLLVLVFGSCVFYWKQSVFNTYAAGVKSHYGVNYKVNFNSITFYNSGVQSSYLLEKLKKLNFKLIKIEKNTPEGFMILVWTDTSFPVFPSNTSTYNGKCNFIVD